MESLGGGVQCRSSDVGSVVIFDFRNVGAEAGSEGEVFRWAMVIFGNDGMVIYLSNCFNCFWWFWIRKKF